MNNRKLARMLALAAGMTTAALAQTPPPLTPPPLTPPAVRVEAAAATPALAKAVPAEVPVKRVVLFSSGVGYFEHYGTVSGDGSTELRFKTRQINDILKSLVLQDMDGGKVTAVTYPSQDPIAKTLKSFQVDITANPPLADLLNQLRGAKVTITVNGETQQGTVLGVERKTKIIGDKGHEATVDEPVLNLVTGGKIVSQPMDGVSSIQLDDPALQAELNQALIALAGARDQDKKPVKIDFTGAGDRRVKLGYVVETPIWKASYRLILGPPLKADQPATRPAYATSNLQGWAIIENQTDNDWNNVELSLVSGRPISFVEDLYQPLYIPRPVVEPELFASLRPQTYAGGMGGGGGGGGGGMGGQDADATTQPTMQPPGLAENAGVIQQLRQASRYRAKELQNQSQGGGANIFGNTNSGSQAYAADLNPVASVGSLASASSIGELFQYTVGNVSLARQRSAMIPIITKPIEVERVSIYNAAVLPRNPLNGARVKNTTTDHLLAGPVTVIDDSAYAGDAQIDNIPPGQERFVSYGVDLQMLVDAIDNKADNSIQTGKIVNGVLVVTHKYVQAQTYVAENKSPSEKTLIIEHGRDAGYDLTDSPVPLEKTDSVYRFKESVPAGKSAKLTVKQQMVTDEQVILLSTDTGTIDFYRRDGAIPKAVQEALARAMQIKNSIAESNRQMTEARQKLTDISAEQSRIRDNLRIVANQTGTYYSRLMAKLNDQETEIEKTQQQLTDLQKQRDTQQKDLETYLGTLNQ